MKGSVQKTIDSKKEELAQFKLLNKYTYDLVLQLEEIEEKLEVMGDGAESVALILSNWQNVINSISLASLGLLKYNERKDGEENPLPETLIRIKLNQEQSKDT